MGEWERQWEKAIDFWILFFSVLVPTTPAFFGFNNWLIIDWCIYFLGTPCFRGHGRRNGERRRKSVRGCIVSPDLSVLNLVIVKKGDNDLPGLTDIEKPRMRGPKRASKIRKLFNLTKDDDVRKYVNTYRRNFTSKTGGFLYYCFILFVGSLSMISNHITRKLGIRQY